MARQASEGESSPLKQRVLSALVLGPIALLAIALGHPFFEVLVGVLALTMAWEWARLCSGGSFGPEGWAIAASLSILTVATLAGRNELALLMAIAGAIAAYLVARVVKHRSAVLLAIAPIVLGLSAVSMVWLRQESGNGLAAVVWMVGAVWATDTAAYFVGRRVGGPRLAPRISPKKTWSGLVGGVCCAALWGVVWGLMPGPAEPWRLAALGAGVAVVAQAGDLAISALKRRFGAKDASGLIPGHGGVLDRCDGFVTAAPIVAGIEWITKGIAWSPI